MLPWSAAWVAAHRLWSTYIERARADARKGWALHRGKPGARRAGQGWDAGDPLEAVVHLSDVADHPLDAWVVRGEVGPLGEAGTSQADASHAERCRISPGAYKCLRMLPAFSRHRGSCCRSFESQGNLWVHPHFGALSNETTRVAPRSNSISLSLCPTKPLPPVTRHLFGTGIRSRLTCPSRENEYY